MSIFQLSSILEFPPVESAEPDGLLAIGGDLSIERLVLAYSHGVFPWYEEDSPILWWSPPKRAILKPQEVHLSRSLKQILKKKNFEVRLDENFQTIIQACAQTPRHGQDGTWITPDMQKAYCALHTAGFAHSVETYEKGTLIGGLYGLSLGGCFFGESMFSWAPNASKVAFAFLAKYLAGLNFTLIDCQIMNPYLASLGAYSVTRSAYLEELKKGLLFKTYRGKWRLSHLSS